MLGKCCGQKQLRIIADNVGSWSFSIIVACVLYVYCGYAVYVLCCELII